MSMDGPAIDDPNGSEPSRKRSGTRSMRNTVGSPGARARTRRIESWEKLMIRTRESCSLRGRARPKRRSSSTVLSSTSAP